MLWARDSGQKRGLVEAAGGTAASPTPRMDVGGGVPPAGLPGHWALRQRCDCSLSGSRQGRRRAGTRCSPKQVALLWNPRDRRGLSCPAWGWAWGRFLLHPSPSLVGGCSGHIRLLAFLACSLDGGESAPAGRPQERNWAGLDSSCERGREGRGLRTAGAWSTPVLSCPLPSSLGAAPSPLPSLALSALCPPPLTPDISQARGEAIQGLHPVPWGLRLPVPRGEDAAAPLEEGIL